MNGFDSADATHLCCRPKYTSPFVSFDYNLIRKAKKLDFYPESPSFN